MSRHHNAPANAFRQAESHRDVFGGRGLWDLQFDISQSLAGHRPAGVEHDSQSHSPVSTDDWGPWSNTSPFIEALSDAFWNTATTVGGQDVCGVLSSLNEILREIGEQLGLDTAMNGIADTADEPAFSASFQHGFSNTAPMIDTHVALPGAASAAPAPEANYGETPKSWPTEPPSTDPQNQPGADTIPGNTSTTFTLVVGGPAQTGYVNTAGDDDWYRVDLVAGQSYAFTLTGSGLSPLQDPYLELRDSNGTLIAIDDNGGPGFGSLLRFTAQTSGTYYLNARAWEDEDTGPSLTGSYTVSAAIGPAQSPLDTINYGYTLPDNTVTVYFATTGETFSGDTAVRNWTASEISSAMAALATFSAITPLTFTQVGSSAGADFVLTLANLDPNVLGHFFIGTGHGAFAPTATGWNASGLQPGGLGFVTLIHELGHGLGLAHPHDNGGTSEIMQGVIDPFNSYGTFQINQGVFTTMSYNDGFPLSPMGGGFSSTFGSQATPMALDVAVLQQKYGVNPTTNSGDTTYQIGTANGAYRAIWDTGGSDTIAFSGTQNAVIDLRAATLQNAVGGAGYVSYATGIHNGFTIAAGVVIENALGGTGNDQIQGNAANNFIQGRAGADTIFGDAGDDWIDGGTGGDTIDGGAGANDTAAYGASVTAVNLDLQANTYSGGDAAGDVLSNVEGVSGSSFNDQLFGNGSNNRLFGQGGADFIQGRAGNDLIDGGDGDDWLDGGTGADQIFGGNGANDIVAYGASTTAVNADLAAFVFSGGDAAGDTYSGVEGVSGSSFADQLFGDANANRLFGQGGNDFIQGRAGNDLIDGGDGDDWLDGGTGGDQIFGGNGANDVVAYGASTTAVNADLGAFVFTGGDAAGDTYSGVEGVSGSAFADQLFGDANANRLFGQGGNDFIQGRAGADLIEGGDGDDWLDGGLGGDTINGGNGTNDTAAYGSSTAAVSLDLLAGVFSGGDAAGDTLTGVEGLSGSALNDTLSGNASANRLFGQGGNDTLAGRGGNDLLTGGDADDIFVFADNGDADQIADFDDFGNDIIQLTISGISAFGDVVSHMTQVGADVLIDFATTDILLLGTTLATVETDDFVFV